MQLPFGLFGQLSRLPHIIIGILNLLPLAMELVEDRIGSLGRLVLGGDRIP